MSDFYSDDYSVDSIEATRKKKVDEFRRNFDKSIMSDESVSEVHGYSDSSSSTRYSTDYSSLKRHRKNNEINSFSDSDTKKRIEKESQKALKQQQKHNKQIEKNKARRNRRIFKWVWLVMVAVVGVVLSQVLLVGINDMLAISREKSAQKVIVSIPADPTIEQIGDLLEEKGVINRSKYFVLYANLTSSADAFRQGEFELDTDKDYEAIINYLQSNVNRSDIVTVQLTEGMNLLEIANKLHEEGVTSDVQKFLDICNSDEFDESYPFLKNIANKDKRYYKLEGYLFPDTYDFYLNEDPKETIDKLLANFEKKVTTDKAKYPGSSKKTTLEKLCETTDYSMDEILTIASIIQAEAANEDDMYYISSILHNRLENGAGIGLSKLNCDCTTYYPYREAKDVPDTIKGTFSSTYNTNNFDGLPAGPICNPSLEAIKAAISPTSTDYYFFCHDTAENGSTPYYATTLDEHEYNLTLIG